MSAEDTDPVPARRIITGDDQLMAVWTAWSLFATIVIWTASGGSGGPGGETLNPASVTKYAIYLLPLSLGAAYYLSFGVEQLRLDNRGLAALAFYLVIAIIGITINPSGGFYAFRDLIIISCYLFLFVFWFRAPPSIVDIALGTFLICLGIESAKRITPDLVLMDTQGLYAILGLANPSGNTLFGPHSITESTIGFPLGVIVLYYIYNRKWRLAAIAGLLQLVAFKRITFAGVAVAVVFDGLLSRQLSFSISRRVALALVLGISILAIFSTSIFKSASDLLQLKNSSADAISLGRYDIAVLLWGKLSDAAGLNWWVGFGAGAADVLSQAVSDLNPHNDWLKILFDYGIVGFCVVHMIFFSNLVRHRLGLMIYLYNSVLMMTDNVFIYMYYHVIISLIMCAARE